MHPIILVLIFIVATVVGYLLIKNVPSLLHTPLMSGMNALSGITVLGALAATGRSIPGEQGARLSCNRSGDAQRCGRLWRDAPNAAHVPP